MANKSKKQQAEEATAQEQATEAKQQYEATSKWRKPLIVVAVVLASLIMAISILLPSLSAVIEAFTSSDETATTTEVETVDAESEDAADSMQGYIDTVDERYSATADSLKAKVEADGSDKASLINLANTYYTWGTAVNNYASSDEQKAHVTELLNNAITYYDQYLALGDSGAAYVNRALCQYYIGDTDAAREALEKYVVTNASYAPAWSNLGMMYNAAGETEKALQAYNNVLTVDPNDEYGLKSNAQSQVDSLSATTDEAETTEAE